MRPTDTRATARARARRTHTRRPWGECQLTRPGRESAPGWGGGRTSHNDFVGAFQGGGERAGVDVPDVDAPIHAAHRHELSIAAEGHGGDRVRMACRRRDPGSEGRGLVNRGGLAAALPRWPRLHVSVPLHEPASSCKMAPVERRHSSARSSPPPVTARSASVGLSAPAYTASVRAGPASS